MLNSSLTVGTHTKALSNIQVLFLSSPDSSVDHCVAVSVTLAFVSSHLDCRVATHPGFPGMSRICTLLSHIPARPALGC